MHHIESERTNLLASLARGPLKRVANCLLIGMLKCGTTSLMAMLAEHPDTWVTSPKEPNFLSYHFHKRGWSWYESLFEDAPAHALYKALPWRVREGLEHGLLRKPFPRHLDWDPVLLADIQEELMADASQFLASVDRPMSTWSIGGAVPKPDDQPD